VKLLTRKAHNGFRYFNRLVDPAPYREIRAQAWLGIAALLAPVMGALRRPLWDEKTRDIWKTFFFSVTMKFPGNLRYFNVHSIVWEEPR